MKNFVVMMLVHPEIAIALSIAVVVAITSLVPDPDCSKVNTETSVTVRELVHCYN